MGLVVGKCAGLLWDIIGWNSSNCWGLKGLNNHFYARELGWEESCPPKPVAVVVLAGEAQGASLCKQELHLPLGKWSSSH